MNSAFTCDCSYQFINHERHRSPLIAINISHKYACCDISSLRDLNQTNWELRWSKLITLQHQHRLLPCPIGPTSLTAPPFISRDRSQTLARIRSRARSLSESSGMPESIGLHTTHTIQETGSGIDERASYAFWLSRRTRKPCPEKHSKEAFLVYHNCI